MSLQVDRVYGYVTRTPGGIGIVADWRCTICGRIVYEKTHVQDIPGEEWSKGCSRCLRAIDLADEVATRWWTDHPFTYGSRRTGQYGFYGLRDDLFGHLVWGKTSPALIRYAGRFGLELPVL